MIQPQTFYHVVTEDFTAVDGIIRRQLTSRVPLVEKIGDYIISAGGKHLHLLLVLLASKTLGYKDDDLCLLATIIEFLYTSILLHDDVIDASGLCRGCSIANTLWNNAPSVLVGGPLYAHSFEMMVELGSMPAIRIIPQATRVTAEGEVLQLFKVHDANTIEETCMEVIRGKTTMLFKVSTHSATALCQASEERSEALRRLGDYLGIAFQLVDDLLDCRGDAATLDKNVGNGLIEGKPTPPLIVTTCGGTKEQVALVRKAIQRGGSQDLESVCVAVEAAGILGYTASLACDCAACAIACLDTLLDNEYRSALVELSGFAITHTY